MSDRFDRRFGLPSWASLVVELGFGWFLCPSTWSINRFRSFSIHVHLLSAGRANSSLIGVLGCRTGLGLRMPRRSTFLAFHMIDKSVQKFQHPWSSSHCSPSRFDSSFHGKTSSLVDRWALLLKRWKTTKQPLSAGALKFTDTKQSLNVSTTRWPTACSATSRPWRCDSPKSQRSTAWVNRAAWSCCRSEQRGDMPHRQETCWCNQRQGYFSKTFLKACWCERKEARSPPAWMSTISSSQRCSIGSVCTPVWQHPAFVVQPPASAVYKWSSLRPTSWNLC